jgi:hypothetical protein
MKTFFMTTFRSTATGETGREAALSTAAPSRGLKLPPVPGDWQLKIGLGEAPESGQRIGIEIGIAIEMVSNT